MKNLSPWWAPHVYADRREFLKARGAITRMTRAFFEARGFCEVETACLQISPGAETHLHAFKTAWIDDALQAFPLYLHTSPEFACKKLLAAGEEKIFTLAKAFRNRERSALHHPEFTMLEWYRAHAPYQTIMEDCAALLASTARQVGARQVEWRGRTADLTQPPAYVTVAQAFETYAGVDLLAGLSDPNAPDRDLLARHAERLEIRVRADDSWSDLFSKILSERIEPNLGLGRPAFLIEYPAPEAALARITPHDPRVAERFELFVCGVELANGFGELTDAPEQRRRFEAAMAEKMRLWGESCPLDEDFLAAVALMPPASGVALGFDRLAMLAAGAPSIEHVLWTPVADGGGDRHGDPCRDRPSLLREI